MGRRQLWECDRCRADLDRSPPTHTMEVHKDQETALDLCDGCASKLGQFLDGTDLEEPP